MEKHWSIYSLIMIVVNENRSNMWPRIAQSTAEHVESNIDLQHNGHHVYLFLLSQAVVFHCTIYLWIAGEEKQHSLHTTRLALLYTWSGQPVSLITSHKHTVGDSKAHRRDNIWYLQELNKNKSWFKVHIPSHIIDKLSDYHLHRCSIRVLCIEL